MQRGADALSRRMAGWNAASSATAEAVYGAPRPGKFVAGVVEHGRHDHEGDPALDAARSDALLTGQLAAPPLEDLDAVRRLALRGHR